MINSDHISESLETNFWIKFFGADPGWKKFISGIQDRKNLDPGNGLTIRDPQYWFCAVLRIRIQMLFSGSGSALGIRFRIQETN